MKKIKSIRQLKAEKKQIKQQQEEIEKRIYASWGEVKESLRPATLAKEVIGGIFKKNTDNNEHDGSLLKTAINVGITLLAGKMAGKLAGIAGEKISKVFKKSDRLS